MTEPFVAEIKEIITRAIADPRFRAALAENAELTLVKAGFKPSPDEVKAIVKARPAEWGDLTLKQVTARILK